MITKLSVGRGLIILAAVMTVVVPFVVNMIVQAGLHMQNPAWLPHAKLHTAMRRRESYSGLDQGFVGEARAKALQDGLRQKEMENMKRITLIPGVFAGTTAGGESADES